MCVCVCVFPTGPDSVYIYLGALHDVVFHRVVLSFFENGYILPVLHNKVWFHWQHRDYPRFVDFIEIHYPELSAYLPAADPDYFALFYKQKPFKKSMREICGAKYDGYVSGLQDLVISTPDLQKYGEESRKDGLIRRNNWFPESEKHETKVEPTTRAKAKKAGKAGKRATRTKTTSRK